MAISTPPIPDADQLKFSGYDYRTYARSVHAGRNERIVCQTREPDQAPEPTVSTLSGGNEADSTSGVSENRGTSIPSVAVPAQETAASPPNDAPLTLNTVSVRDLPAGGGVNGQSLVSRRLSLREKDPALLPAPRVVNQASFRQQSMPADKNLDEPLPQPIIPGAVLPASSLPVSSGSVFSNPVPAFNPLQTSSFASLKPANEFSTSGQKDDDSPLPAPIGFISSTSSMMPPLSVPIVNLSSTVISPAFLPSALPP